MENNVVGWTNDSVLSCAQEMADKWLSGMTVRAWNSRVRHKELLDRNTNKNFVSLFLMLTLLRDLSQNQQGQRINYAGIHIWEISCKIGLMCTHPVVMHVTLSNMGSIPLINGLTTFAKKIISLA